MSLYFSCPLLLLSFPHISLLFASSSAILCDSPLPFSHHLYFPLPSTSLILSPLLSFPLHSFPPLSSPLLLSSSLLFSRVCLPLNIPAVPWKRKMLLLKCQNRSALSAQSTAHWQREKGEVGSGWGGEGWVRLVRKWEEKVQERKTEGGRLRDMNARELKRQEVMERG